MKQPPQITDRNIQLAINVLQVSDGGYFIVFIDMLKDWLQQHRVYGDDAEGRDMVENQGSIKILKHLIDEIAGNRERMNKMQEFR